MENGDDSLKCFGTGMRSGDIPGEMPLIWCEEANVATGDNITEVGPEWLSAPPTPEGYRAYGYGNIESDGVELVVAARIERELIGEVMAPPARVGAATGESESVFR